MIKLGVIGDIHGNPYALNTALAEFDRRGIDGLLVAGDIIGMGFMGEECVQILQSRNDIVASVRGNHEEYFTIGLEDRMTDEERAFHIWEHARLTEASKKYIRALPVEAELTIENTHIYMKHYPIEYHTQKNDHQRARELIKKADVSIYAHDHFRSVVEEYGTIYADFGSLGCPGRLKNIARAGIITVSAKAAFELLDLEYDIEPFIRQWDITDPPARKTVQRMFFGIC